jgi:segregation and condensation protein A
MEVASEFILVAATLMRIKAKMLLPRPVLDEQGNEIDPREELIKHLLEYKKYKAAVQEFLLMEEKMLTHEKRANLVKEIKKLSEVNSVESEIQHLDLYKLLKVYERVTKRYEANKNRPIHTVVPFPYTIEQQREYVMDKISKKERVSFEEIILDNQSKIAIIFNFLAILDLLQAGSIFIHIGLGYNNFWIEKNVNTTNTISTSS